MKPAAPQHFYTLPGILAGVLCGLASAVFPSALQAQASSDLDPLRKLNSSVEALVKKVSPSVVQILTTGYGPLEEASRGSAGLVIGRQRAIGSGFIIDSSGYIITNAHVVSGAQRVQVILPMASGDLSPKHALATRGTALPARIVGANRDIDLALLKIEGADFPVLPVAKYSGLRQGQIVFAFGSPGGLRNSVTMGVVSSVARQTDPDSTLVYIQTDAPINPGNSGGPLVNVNGEVVGVNTFILTQSGGNEGLGFAIPSSLISAAYTQLREYGHIHRGEIGAFLQTITPELAAALHLPRDSGVIVSDVVPGGPAASAGLRIQDILLSVDGDPADSVPYVAFRLLSRGPDQKVTFEVLRGADPVSIDVTLFHPPHEMDELAALADPNKSLVRPLGILGVTVDERIASMISGLRDFYGVLVVARSADGAADIPLTTGDVIRALNGRRVTKLDDLRNALKQIPAGSPVALQVQRENRLIYVTFVFDQP
jgi:serine protease Do